MNREICGISPRLRRDEVGTQWWRRGGARLAQKSANAELARRAFEGSTRIQMPSEAGAGEMPGRTAWPTLFRLEAPWSPAECLIARFEGFESSRIACSACRSSVMEMTGNSRTRAQPSAINPWREPRALRSRRSGDPGRCQTTTLATTSSSQKRLRLSSIALPGPGYPSIGT